MWAWTHTLNYYFLLFQFYMMIVGFKWCIHKMAQYFLFVLSRYTDFVSFACVACERVYDFILGKLLFFVILMISTSFD